LDASWVKTGPRPRLVEIIITPEGQLLGRCGGESSLEAFLRASEDLIKNIHGVAQVAELDGDELGYLVAKKDALCSFTVPT
jgi:hypothetical protein